MSFFTVDADGKRIKTDILVSGWIRDFGKLTQLLIPNDVTKICFMYWLIKCCDEWLREYTPNGVIMVVMWSKQEYIHGNLDL